MKIPQVRHNEQLNAHVKLDPTSKNKFNRFFAITNDRTRVVIAPSARKSWIEGRICPADDEIPILFLIESAIAGDSEHKTQVRIDTKVESEFRLVVSNLQVEDEQI